MSDVAQVNITEGPPTEHGRWCAEIEKYDRLCADWHKRSKKIIRRYRDERGNIDIGKSRYNILWSNVQTIRPAVYGRDPITQVESRFKDNTPLAVAAADVLERAVEFCKDTQPFGQIMRYALTDRLLPGRGTVWARYCAYFKGKSEHREDEESPELEAKENPTGQLSDVDTAETLDYEEAPLDYVHWQDFGHTEGRTWEEKRAVWRIVYMNRQELVQRFGKKIGMKVPLDYTPKETDDQKKPAVNSNTKARIYEIWDGENKEVIWLSQAYPDILDRRQDPLKLDGFFPCPRPLYSTLANDSLIPVPDYYEYQDQAMELDLLTARINAIVKSIKVAGVCDGSVQGLQRLLSEGVENKLIQVDSWAMFAEKGGLNGAISLLPMEDIAKTALSLYEARDRIKNDLYEITGMADIIRGNSDPNETATAQQIKGKFASLRLTELQTEMQRFARDALSILGEIIANHFEPETLMQISGKQYLTEQQKQQMQMQIQQTQVQYQQQAQMQGQQPPQQPQIPYEIQKQLSDPTWEEIIQLLRDRPMRRFSIDIETDSTISINEEVDKQQRLEFVTTVGQFINQTGEAIKNLPQLAPVAAEMLSFLSRGYAAGRGLQGCIDKLAQQIKDNPQQGQQPDPKVMAEQMKQQTVMLQQQGDQKELAMKGQLEQQKMAAQSEQNQTEIMLEKMRLQLEQMKQMNQPAQPAAPAVDHQAIHSAIQQALQPIMQHIQNSNRTITIRHEAEPVIQ